MIIKNSEYAFYKTPNENSGKHILEYSVGDHCFHISKADDQILKNIRNSMDGISKDYVLVGIYNTNEEAFNDMVRIREQYGL